MNSHLFHYYNPRTDDVDAYQFEAFLPDHSPPPKNPDGTVMWPTHPYPKGYPPYCGHGPGIS